MGYWLLEVKELLSVWCPPAASWDLTDGSTDLPTAFELNGDAAARVPPRTTFKTRSFAFL